VDPEYETYCLVDPDFYDSPYLHRRDDTRFEIARLDPPPGWARTELEDWLAYQPDGRDVPSQGWKIHVSACLHNAEEVLRTTFEYCIARTVPFKFVPSRDLLLLANSKYAARASSGKFVTIYPVDERELEVILTELGALVEGQPGPYVLSDLRWGAGPLYVRYGAFAERWCIGPTGEQVPAIVDGAGRLVPDRREPVFRVPEWVALPSFLESHLAARNAAAVDQMPFGFEAALHFSNGGGLYRGSDLTTGEPVVIKEARPHAGLDMEGEDAVTRLERERDMLARLSDLDVVPHVRAWLTAGEHRFLVEDFVEASPLDDEVVERYPYITFEPDPVAVADYAAWALDIQDRVERAVGALHERGIVMRDIHPRNILVLPDGRIVLVDFEMATPVESCRRQVLADPGFAAPADRTGFDIDRYALACLRLYLFLPMSELIGLAPEKAESFAQDIAQVFPVPGEFLREAAAIIAGPTAGSSPTTATGSRKPPPHRLEPDPGSFRSARDSMAAAILASATPERSDRLFPGDVKQFTTGGLNVAYGAAGVLYALQAVGAGRYPQYEDWLVTRALAPVSGTRLGFYDGLHGVAYVLDRLGRRDDALAVLHICRRELAGKLPLLGLDLFGGLAGMGLNLAHFAAATGDPSLHDEALGIARLIADRLGGPDDVHEISGGSHPYAGLVRGSSGPALLFLQLFEETGEEALLDLTATALRQDLRRCVESDDGSLQVDEGWRTMPYLADGSVGIGIVLDRYLDHRPDEQFAAAAERIRRAAEGLLYVQPGLFYGRAGMILYLARNRAPGEPPSPAVASQIRHLSWHALSFRGHLAFPGEYLLRLSMDLASGTAGVLLALGAALHDEPVGLPFIGLNERPVAAN
jgi:class III lanthionine synthetase